MSLTVPAGSIFGFLGPNGAGKTTTIRMLLGLLAPGSGTVRVLGLHPVEHGDEVRRRCGALLEHTGLYERLSAVENLEFAARLRGISPRVWRPRAAQLLDRFGLAGREADLVGTWSRGMKQKLAIARALLHEPELVFLDEPSSGLDPVSAASLRADVLALAADEGRTVFITTHNLDEAERICDEVAIIKEGRLLAAGSPEDLRRSLRRSTILVTAADVSDEAVRALREAPGAFAVLRTAEGLSIEIGSTTDTADLLPILVAHGVRIQEFKRSDPSLEEAFLSALEA